MDGERHQEKEDGLHQNETSRTDPEHQWRQATYIQPTKPMTANRLKNHPPDGASCSRIGQLAHLLTPNDSNTEAIPDPNHDSGRHGNAGARRAYTTVAQTPS